jgi:hypothetical protein
MERWQFIESPNGAWYWLCSDVISHHTKTSAATFETRSECVADAAGSGYENTAFGAPRAVARSRPQGKRRYPGSRTRLERYT